MIKHMALIAIFVTAVLFTMGGQGLAYFLEGLFDTGYPIYYLTGLLVVGFLLFVAGITIALILRKRKKMTDEHSKIYVSFGSVIGLICSFVAFLITVMWWG